jgi:hypothetical protein
MPRLCQYSALHFGASDVMSFAAAARGQHNIFAKNEEPANEESTRR